MNSGGLAGPGIFFYTITAKILGQPITATGVILAAIFSLLPDADVVITYIITTEHRKITHSPYFAAPLLTLTAIFSAPLAASLLSHYLADYVYPATIQKLIPPAPGNPVSKSEYYSAAVLGSSLIYSYALIKTKNTWFATASAIAIASITLTAIHETMKKHRTQKRDTPSHSDHGATRKRTTDEKIKKSLQSLAADERHKVRPRPLPCPHSKNKINIRTVLFK